MAADAPPAALPGTDLEGYLADPADWNEALAHELAQREGISLAPEHWVAIRFMRRYWEEHQVAPDARHVMRTLAQELENADRNLLFRLFPYGYVQQACKIAGMKRPRAWSTG
jgi:tRNA 2-thiouridine synthesizing protein E